MQVENVKEIWQTATIETPAISDRDPIAAIKQRARKLNRTLFWRDTREYVAAAAVMIIFGYFFLMAQALIARAACAVIVLWGAFVIGYVESRKRRNPRPAPDTPILQSLRIERKKILTQIELLRSVFWWYLLPPNIGVFLLIFADLPPAGFLATALTVITVVLIVVVFDLLIDRMNQRAADQTLLPLLRELEAQLGSDGPGIPESAGRAKGNTATKAFALLAVAVMCFLTANLSALTPSSESRRQYDDIIEQMLEEVRVKYRLPALAGAAVRDSEIVAIGAVGTRKQGDATRVEGDDRFHLGSITKSMTATVAAMLVDDEVLSWNTTIAEAFPNLGDSIHSDYRTVTLEQLLAHRGGAPSDPPRALWREAWRAEGTPAEQRLRFVRGLLEREPEAPPGTNYLYSNQGYAIAGAMLEAASGHAWEELMRMRLFEPLEMSTAGFGAPASPGTVDQPWGHHNRGLLGLGPVPPGPRADNPAAIGPAGTVHCSIEDLAKYASFHLTAANGMTDLLTPESTSKLHTPIEGQDYSLGWVVVDRDWAGGRALMHAGSNTMNYALIWLAPERNRAFIAATNTGADNAFQACDETIANLIRHVDGQ